MVQSIACVSTSKPFRCERRGLTSALTPLAEDYLVGTHRRKELTDAQGQSFLNERVVDPIGVPALKYQTRILQHAQMPGDRRGADGES